MSEIKEKISKNAVAAAISLSFYGLTTFIYNVLIGRMYGAETLGLANTALSIAFLVGLFVAFFTNASNKITAEYLGKGKKESANYLITFSIISTAVIGVVIIILLLLSKHIFMRSFNLVNTIFFQLLFLIPLRGIFGVFRGIYYGAQRVTQYQKIVVASSLIFLIMLIPLQFKLLPVLIPFNIMYSVFVVASIYLFKDSLTIKLPKEIKREIQKYAIVYSFIAIIGSLAAMGKNYLGVMFSAIFLNPIQVGYYSAANSVLNPLSYVPTIVPYALFPVLSYEFGKNNIKGIKNMLNRILALWAVTLGMITGLAIIYSKLLIYIFFGVDYLAAVSPLIILIIGFYFNSIIIPMISVLSGTKYVHISTLTGVISFLTSIGAFIVLIPKYGIVGSALGIAIGNIMAIILPFYFLKKVFDFKIKNFFYPFIKFAIPLLFILLLFYNSQMLLYTLGGGLFAIFYILSNKGEVIYLYEEVKKQLMRDMKETM